MDLSKLSPAERIIALCGAALLILSIFPWFGFGADPFEIRQDAWDNPLTLLAVIIGVVMAAQVIAARSTKAKTPPKVKWGQVHLVLGAVAFGLVLLQYLIGDEYSAPGISIDLERKAGLFLGLLASAGLAYGGFRKSKEPEAAGPRFMG
jgi:4-amino-4-deoxy-L-arabinose transferase-like glycosyltransferase